MRAPALLAAAAAVALADPVLEGYDMVAYVERGEPVLGSRAHAYNLTSRAVSMRFHGAPSTRVEELRRNSPLVHF